MEQPERKCRTCGVSKPLNSDNFYKPGKYFSRECKECVNQRRRERWANDEEHREKLILQMRYNYAATHTERECAWCEATKPKEEFPNQAGVQVCYACRENPPAERKCNICEELKSSSEFEKGHDRNQCRECRKELRRQRIAGRADTEWECGGCNQVKPASDFQGDARVCKICVNRKRKERRANDLAWAEQQRERKRQAYADNPEPVRQSALKRWSETSRTCAVCEQPKLPKEFVKNRQICQECFDLPYRKCRWCGEQRPSERFSEQALHQCMDCQNSMAYKWRDENPEKVQESRWKTKYGLSKAEREAMELAQGGLCAICKQGKKLVIDHSHESSEVRGLLCQKCNTGIGYFEEDESLFLSAVKYLRQPGLAPELIIPITDESLFSRFEIPHWEAQSRDKALRSAKNRSLKKQYGITIDQYESLLAQRDGVCWVCARPETIKQPKAKRPDALSVDHSHENGLIRGLLCRNCNWGIDAFGDDAERIEQAMEYLAQRTTPDIGD